MTGQLSKIARWLLILLIVAVVAAAPSTTFLYAGVASGAQTGGSIPSDEVFDVTNSGQIQAWERSAFPLRADRFGAGTQITLPENVIGSGTNAGDGNLNPVTSNGDRNPAGVFNKGTSVAMVFDPSRANYAGSNLANQDRVQVLAARITGSGEQFPNSIADATDIFSDIDNANANASFEFVEDSNGNPDLQEMDSGLLGALRASIANIVEFWVDRPDEAEHIESVSQGDRSVSYRDGDLPPSVYSGLRPYDRRAVWH